jgi:DNA-binding beta-propeller fold protein YncE
MKGAFSVALVVFSAAAAAIVAAQSSGNTAAAAKPTESARGGQAPIFEVDPFWPKPLPNHWVMGSTIGLSVDDQDHVWVIHRPQSVEDNFKAAETNPPIGVCCKVAPPVLEFDQAGNLVSSWGGPGAGYEWPVSNHGITVDHKGNVWIGGNDNTDTQILKFTKAGKFLLQIGKHGVHNGSNDVENLWRAAKIFHEPEANEIYVADGYGNRRVIVLDAETFAFKRMWGAYGNKPSDMDLGPYDPDAPPAQQFRLPHNISISKDGFVYVADRPNNRIQVFRKDGTFVKEAFISKRTLLQGAASGFALSPDPEQRFLYMIDGANHHVWILNRSTLQVIARFGQQGLWGGSLNVPHAIAVDSKGNIYVGENFDARRFQRFLFKGLGTPKPGTIPPTTIVR